MIAYSHRLFLLCLVVLGGCVTPTSIVQEAAEAARKNDLEGYVACFTPRSQPLLRAFYANVKENRPELATIGAQEIHVTSRQTMSAGVDNRDRTLLKIRENSRTIPLVLHKVTGSWRIDLVDSEHVLTGLGTPF